MSLEALNIKNLDKDVSTNPERSFARALILTPDNEFIIRPPSSNRATYDIELDQDSSDEYHTQVVDVLNETKNLPRFMVRRHLGMIGSSSAFLLQTFTSDISKMNHRESFTSRADEFFPIRQLAWTRSGCLDTTDIGIISRFENFMRQLDGR